MKTFPYTTPTGHTYAEPTTAREVGTWIMNSAQAWLEHWDEAEHPPEPPAWVNPLWAAFVMQEELLERSERLLREALTRAESASL